MERLCQAGLSVPFKTLNLTESGSSQPESAFSEAESAFCAVLAAWNQSVTFGTVLVTFGSSFGDRTFDF